MNLDLFVSGLASGAAYGLVALGIVLIYKGTRVINFAQGEFGTIALFVAWEVMNRWHLSYGFAALIALAFVALLGLGVERAVVRPLLGAPRITMLVATVGLLIAFGTLEFRIWGANPKIIAPPISGRGFQIGSAFITPTRMLTFAAAAVIGIALWAFLKRTTFGLGVLAAAEDRATVQLSGLKLGRVSGFTWATAAVVGGVGALLLAPAVGTFHPLFMTVGLTKALAAALIGGLTSIRGAFVGGLLVGTTEAMLLGLFPQRASIVDGGIFVLILLVLLLRPQGLFGTATQAQPAGFGARGVRRGGPRISPKIAFGALAVAAAAIPLMSDYNGFVFGWMLIAATLGLSLNVLSGYAGQISLGHGAFLGLGAAVAAFLSAQWLWPFAAAIPGALAAGALAGLLVGLPALRIRGMELAVTTLAFAVAFEKLLLPEILRGRAGLEAERPYAGVVNFLGNRSYAYLALAGLVLAWWVDRNFHNSRPGRAAAAMRDDELVASSFGISVAYHKLFAFGLSGAIAGLAGGLFAFLLQLVSSAGFPLFLSLTFVAAAVVGGLRSRAGVVVGVAAFVAVPQLFEGLRLWGQFLGATLVVVTVIRNPGGIAEAAREVMALITRRKRASIDLKTPEAPPVVAPVSVIDTPRVILDRELLRVEALTIRYGGAEVLSGVSLAVREGATVGLIGPNGAGKTTLFNAISGFVDPAGGRITFDDRDITAMAPHRRALLGIRRTFQLIGLVKTETVLTNLMIAQHDRLRYSDAQALLRMPAVRKQERIAEARARELLAEVGLSDIAGARVADLPHGTLKLVELVCAAASEPKLLLLDETSSGMGPGEVRALAAIVRDLRARFGFSILMIEHHVPLVLDVCDHVYAIDFGKPVADGPPADIARHPDVMRAYLGEEPPARIEVPVASLG